MAHKVGHGRYLIEDSYPIPEPQGTRYGSFTPMRQAIRAMDVGQSITVEVDKRDSAKTMMRMERLQNEKEFTSRKVNDDELRIWRTK